MLGLAPDVVELHPQGVADHLHRLTEDGGAAGCHRRQIGVVDRAAKARRLLGVRRVVGGGVRLLAHGDLVDAVGRARRHDRQELDEPGADAGPEHRGPAPLAGGGDPVTVAAQRVAGDEGRGADDVDAGFEDAHELVDVPPHGVVHDAVGFQGQQGVDVVGGGHAHRVDAAQLADVSSDLVGGPRVAADELQIGAFHDAFHRPFAHVPRGPLDDAQRHQPEPTGVNSRCRFVRPRRIHVFS